MPEVDREPVRDVHQRMRGARELASLVDAATADATYRPARNAAPAAPSGPVTTSMSPGRAPARPGTRSLRPSAVTLMHDDGRRGRVAADDRDAGLGDPFVEREHVVELGLRRAARG